LADRILGIHVEFENQYSNDKIKIDRGLSIVQEKCDDLAKRSSNVIDLQRMGNEHHTAYKAQMEELIKRVDVSRETVCITSIQDSNLLTIVIVLHVTVYFKCYGTVQRTDLSPSAWTCL